MKRQYYETQKPGAIMRLLWKCAGADRYLLERSTYSDQVKYMCMGGVVLATGIMAMMAGGYAFYTIFEPKGDAMQNYILHEYGKASGYVDVTHMPTMLMASVFGLIWGLIIFNLDRFIVSSTGKGDGTEAITWEEFKGAIPRIIMGVIIAITISKPLEIRMFKSEIDVKLHEKQKERNNQIRNTIDSTYRSDMNRLEAQILKRQSRIDELDSISDFLKGQIAYETSHGDCKSKCEEFKKQLASNQVEIGTLQKDPEYAKIKSELDTLSSRRDKEMNQTTTVVSGLDGLLERIRICDDPDVAGGWITLFITLLFMAIELTPIFFKLMLIQGPYDYMMDNVKELIKAENGIEVKYDYYQGKKGQERHLVIYHKPEVEIHEKKKWAESQREITEKAIDKWKEGQLKRVDENISDFIKEE